VIHFLDTSALKWAYIPQAKYCRRCRFILTRLKGQVYIAEISILELASALGHEVRGNRMSVAEYTRASRRFFQDIAEGKIEVRPFPSSEYIPCRDLLSLVGIGARRNLECQDGIVAYTARRLAIERRVRVKLLTSDKKLAGVIRETDLFSGLVVSEYLDPN
jgi:predicted nucleic acid-binding protein